MSQASTSLDLSEFFKSDDDSDGQRLAEYLQKRRGGAQRQKFVFLNSEPPRFSIRVELEKLPPSQQQHVTTVNSNGDSNDKNNVINENEDKTIVEEKELNPTNNGKGEVNEKSCRIILKKVMAPNNNNNIGVVSTDKIESVKGSLPLPTVSSKKASPCGPLSPRLSAIKKGGGVTPSDKLRRYSLKRLSKMCNGRRTLLQEFESTVSNSNFDPPSCSTPLSHTPRNKSISLQASIPHSESENQSIVAGLNSSSNNFSSDHTGILLRKLQRRDEELKNIVENNSEATLNNRSLLEKAKSTQEKDTENTLHPSGSPLKRRYTVEKGSSPGHIILRPEEIPRSSVEYPKVLRTRTQRLPDNKLKLSERKTTSIRVEDSKHILYPINLNKTAPIVKNSFKHLQSRAATTVSISRSFKKQQNKSSKCNKPAQEILNTPPPQANHISIILAGQEAMDVEILETQNIPAELNNIVDIQSNNENRPVVVIPVSQNLNRTNTAIGQANKTTFTTQTETPKSAINANQTIGQDDVNVNKQIILNEINEDNIKLTHIITDDEDETPKAIYSSIENSQAPLNLDLKSTNIRTTRLRNRSKSGRNLRMDNSQPLIETENEPCPPAYYNSYSITRRRFLKSKHINLNKPPGTPINGEKFAKELARMSNYEILDLRKRNSLGKIFPISGRKSTRATENSIKKQQQLDDQIDTELLRRNLHSDHSTQFSNGLTACNANAEVPVQEAQGAFGEFPSAPDGFCDSRESFVDEKITDRISFKSKENSSNKTQLKKRKKSKKSEMPEELKQYLRIPEIITQKKKNCCPMDQTRRSLYSQKLSDSLDNNSSEENSIIELNQNRCAIQSSKESLPYLKSPPKTTKITTPKVVSPAPPINPPGNIIRSELENLELSLITGKENEFLLPPPPNFDSDSRGSSPNNFNAQISTDNDKQTTELTDTNRTTRLMDNNTNKNDDEIFKKPLHPPPKRKVRKEKTVNSISNTLPETSRGSQKSDESADETGNINLRRSKRGHVPLKESLPIFRKQLEKTLFARWEESKKRKQQKKLLKINRQSIENSTSSQRSKKTRERKSTLSTIPENDLLTVTKYPKVANANEISTSKKEPKAKRNQNKNKKSKTSNDAFECSHLTLATPPPIDHLNNVFDQLRDSSFILNSQCSPHPTIANEVKIPKVKPVKVRIARLKSSRISASKSAGILPAVNKCQQTHNSTTNTTCISSISYSLTGTNNNSNYELISWLKNITDTNDVPDINDAIFKKMRISAAATLSFTELRGIEYAFYDTQEKASVGYLRFKSRQKKPKKKAKRFHLHFIILVGHFRITANNEETIMNVGDMVAIEKGVYYDIENLTDDIGILMVIKK